MNKENSEYLTQHYPNLYKDYGGDPRHTLMAFGFEVGDGWFDLLNRLSQKLEALGVVAMQVKEKFGGLRFYIDGAPTDKADEIYDAIDEAEEESLTICEKCGDPGEARGGGWVRTLCDSCSYDRYKDAGVRPEGV